MKSLISAPTLAALALGVFALSCAAGSPGRHLDDRPSSGLGSGSSSYAIATSPDELERLIAQDLEAGESERVIAGLEAFYSENVTRGTTTRAHLIWLEVDPVTRVQQGGGRRVMTGVQTISELLATSSEREMASALKSIEEGDFDEVRRLREEPMGVFHASTAAMSGKVLAYAMLADGALAYEDLSLRTTIAAGDLDATLDRIRAARTSLVEVGDDEGVAIADALADQAVAARGASADGRN